MVKQLFFLLFLVVLATPAMAQKYFTSDGKIKFSSDTPLRKIEGTTNSASCALETSSGQMAWRVLVKGFKFEKALMEEHFNENYMESEKYPKAVFTGTITNLNEIDFKKDGTYNAVVSGNMEIHGVKKPLTTNGALTVKGGSVRLNAGFKVACADYNIDIPSVVRDEIAKEINVLVDATLTPKQ
ncbi:MAG: YceI family protein [Saprospiraceae bacterium]|nr:YceI family protein [Saprospiraceae bacterium]